MRVLGIDPGLRLTGYACLQDVARAMVPRVVEAGVFRLNAKASVSDRLIELQADLESLIERVRPELVAVEQLYAHYKHPATAIVMGHARGVILLTIRRANLGLVELRPSEVKKAATGYGQAGKPQIQRAMQIGLGLAELPEPPDVADAMAIGWCGLRRAKLPALPRLAVPRRARAAR